MAEEEKNQEGERQDFGGCSSEADVITVHLWLMPTSTS
jgi:hypothetical protein